MIFPFSLFHSLYSRSVDMVLIKIKLLLQNGTQHIQDKLLDIQSILDTMKSRGEKEVSYFISPS